MICNSICYPIFRVGAAFVTAFKSTESVEIIFRVAAKAIRFYQQFIAHNPSIGWLKLHSQLKESYELLGVLKTFHITQEIFFKDNQGLYLFQRHSLFKSLNLIFSLVYTIFINYKLMKAYKFIQMGKIDEIVFWNLSWLKCFTNGSTILYRSFSACEAIRTKTWWKVATSIGKIVITILEMMITAEKIQFMSYIRLIRGASLGLDSFTLFKKIGVL